MKQKIQIHGFSKMCKVIYHNQNVNKTWLLNCVSHSPAIKTHYWLHHLHGNYTTLWSWGECISYNTPHASCPIYLRKILSLKPKFECNYISIEARIVKLSIVFRTQNTRQAIITIESSMIDSFFSKPDIRKYQITLQAEHAIDIIKKVSPTVTL